MLEKVRSAFAVESRNKKHSKDALRKDSSSGRFQFDPEKRRTEKNK